MSLSIDDDMMVMRDDDDDDQQEAYSQQSGRCTTVTMAFFKLLDLWMTVERQERME